jgi:hypothetical protein
LSNRVDDHRLEGVIAFADFGARVEQVLPVENWDLVNVEGIQAWLCGQEQRAFRL